MKDYFNLEERTRHIILLAMQENAKDIMQSQALTAEERRALSKIHEWCVKFNASIFDRFGDAYARKIKGTMQANTLRLVGKYSENIHAISNIATEDLKLLLDEVHAFKCLDCDKTNFKDCAIYNICISCDVEPNGNSAGCPFKNEIGDI